MPPCAKAQCSECGYASEMLVFSPWGGVAVCGECREFVLGETCWYRPLDPSHTCIQCGQPVSLWTGDEEVHCPKCTRPMVLESGIAFMGNWNTRYELAEGTLVQVRRLGVSEGSPLGSVGHHEAKLTGELADMEGSWWGEARVTCLRPLTVEVITQLTEAKSIPSRLELCFPVTREPWFAVDLVGFRSASETQPLACRAAQQAWAPDGLEEQGDTAMVEVDPLYASRLFHMLLNQPTTVHCLSEVHDGAQWIPWSECHMVVCYSQNRQLMVYPDQPPPGSASIEHCGEVHTPFWVDLYRGWDRVVRWGQQRMLKRRR